MVTLLSNLLIIILWTTGRSWFLSSVLKVVAYHEKFVNLNFPELVVQALLQHCVCHLIWIEFSHLNSSIAVGFSIFLHFYDSRSGGGQSAICNSWSTDVIGIDGRPRSPTLTYCSVRKATVSPQDFRKVTPISLVTENSHFAPIKTSESRTP